MPTPTPGLIVQYEHGGVHYATVTADGEAPLALCGVSSNYYGTPPPGGRLYLRRAPNSSRSRLPCVRRDGVRPTVVMFGVGGFATDPLANLTSWVLGSPSSVVPGGFAASSLAHQGAFGFINRAGPRR